MLTTTLFIIATAHADASLHFDGVDDHVSMGEAASLGLSAFTLECWFRWDGEGSDTASTGSGGVSHYPLVGKGRGEQDGSNVDMNYGLGIDATSGALAADFEDMADGSNHPITGSTDARDGAWHHAAVTYDGSAWALFLDGMLDATADTGGATPRYDSLQHLAVGTSMSSAGAPDGRFRGAIDEVRIWSRARSVEEIRGTMNQAVTAEQDLAARWGFDEGSGATAADSVGGEDGTVQGAAWTPQAPFDASLPPVEPVLVQPGAGATGIAVPATLEVTVQDPEADPLTVTFYGRQRLPAADDFAVIMLPDSQYYCSGGYDGEAEMFMAQTEWIVAQREALNIAWVAHVGDLVNNADEEPQWLVADQVMSVLEDPSTTGLADGIPYGIAPGNHDQDPAGDPDGSTALYNDYFGVHRFEDRAYYGDHFGDDNDDHWGVFSAGGLDFLVIDLEYDQSGVDTGVLPWADEVISDHPDHRVIINAHHLLEDGGTLSDQGLWVYEALGHHDSLFLMLSGHLTAESWRSDPAGDAGTVYTVMADYQFDGNGGDGWLRVMEFSPAAGSIHMWTTSPWLNETQDDEASDFVLPYDMQPTPFTELGSVEVASGDNAALEWNRLDPLTDYEWYVTVNDGGFPVTGPIWTFTTGDGEEPTDDTGAPSDTDNTDDDTPGVRGVDDDCGCSGTAGASGATLLLGLLGLVRRRRSSEP